MWAASSEHFPGVTTYLANMYVSLVGSKVDKYIYGLLGCSYYVDDADNLNGF